MNHILLSIILYFLLIFSSFNSSSRTEITRENEMKLFSNDAVWLEYKELYDKINSVKELEDIDKLEIRVDKLSSNLMQKNTSSDEVIKHLFYLLQDEINIAYTKIQKSQRKNRKYREPDYIEDIRHLNKRIRSEIIIIRYFLKESNKGAWVKSTIYKGIEVSIELIETKIKLLDSKVKNNNTTISKDNILFLNEVNSNISNAYTLLDEIKKNN